ncbi:MAG: protein-export membrane protein SecF [Candidatus Babeliales bacterium]
MINFLKYRYICGAFSLLFLLASLGLYLYKWQTRGYTFVYSVDFTGGTQVLLKFDKPVSVCHLKDILEKNGWKNATTREFSAPEEVLVRVSEFSNDAKGLAERMKTAISTEIPDNPVSILQSEGVGPGVGQTLRWRFFLAVVIALLAILIYIAVRFWSFAFAIGAIVGLIHDPLAILGIFLLFDIEISVNVIGVILTVIGYSINDTIVIFSRIRENLHKMKESSLHEIVNVSINKTLRRSVLTVFATALSVLSMLFFGGEALRDFSLALLIGIVFGAYSSIYIASPVMMWLYKEDKK